MHLLLVHPFTGWASLYVLVGRRGGGSHPAHGPCAAASRPRHRRGRHRAQDPASQSLQSFTLTAHALNSILATDRCREQAGRRLGKVEGHKDDALVWAVDHLLGGHLAAPGADVYYVTVLMPRARASSGLISTSASIDPLSPLSGASWCHHGVQHAPVVRISNSASGCPPEAQLTGELAQAPAELAVCTRVLRSARGRATAALPSMRCTGCRHSWA